jgi:hypothetical protein
MTFWFQVALDCTDPHVLAAWWARALGWQVEEQDEAFIRSMVEQGHATEADTRQFEGRLVWREGAAVTPPQGSPLRTRLYFQAVPEPKAVKNRMHLDLRSDDDADRVRERFLDLGATKLSDGRQGPHTWWTMADPEGNEFCV